MSQDERTITPDPVAPPPIPFERPRKRRVRGQRLPKPARPKLRKLRLLAVVIMFWTLAGISTLFGMMMAIASDLPQLENKALFKDDRSNSYLYDDQGRPIGILAAPENRVLDNFDEVSPWMRRAIVAVEDRRFWTEPGVDIRGLARAFFNDLTGGATQGASTIPEQFVKQTLNQENNRTILEKLREAVLAYHLTRLWSKKKILREYLNTIYFGRGAYGIESAARVYFGRELGFDDSATSSTPGQHCGDANSADPKLPKCASLLQPWQAATLAGMVANPSAFDPIAFPQEALGRRNTVLADMLSQNYITRPEYEQYIHEPLPTSLEPPQQPTAAPYFTSWLEPQIIAALHKLGVPRSLAALRTYYGGLKIRTTIDLQMQQAAQQAVDAEFPPGSNGPTATLVAIDNHTGQVRAMVSGNQSYSADPFNLATEGHRQAGSAFKPFTLAEALVTGEYGPGSVIDSAPQDFIVPNSGGKEHFIVHNFGNTYSGPITLQEATAISDNSVFAQVGIHVGTKRIARLAERMGIRSPVSDNYAMILGAPKVGVSALDMAHAFETFATGGLKVYDPRLGDRHGGPIGIQSISCPNACPFQTVASHPVYQRILPLVTAETVHTLLQGVVSPGGTAPNAAIPGVDVAGKTGTTSNYVDAWFVGWTPELTTAVWVGYPNSSVPMTTAYNGQPVEGGTFPALIWRDFMEQALQIQAAEAAAAAAHQHPSTVTTVTGTGTGAAPSTSTGSATSTGPAHTTTNGTAHQTATTGGAAGAATGAGTTTAPQGGGTATGPQGGGTPTTAGGTPTTGGGGGTPTTGAGGGTPPTSTGSGGAGLGGGGGG